MPNSADPFFSAVILEDVAEIRDVTVGICNDVAQTRDGSAEVLDVGWRGESKASEAI